MIVNISNSDPWVADREVATGALLRVDFEARATVFQLLRPSLGRASLVAKPWEADR
jgi:hypothetical protein